VTSARGERPREEVARFIERLTREERMLIVLKQELYDGSWDGMIADLEARLQGRPYVFKLANRIGEDLERISRLKAFEDEKGVDLGEMVKL